MSIACTLRAAAISAFERCSSWLTLTNRYMMTAMRLKRKIVYVATPVVYSIGPKWKWCDRKCSDRQCFIAM